MPPEVIPKSKISAAPFPNLDNSGGICFGSNEMPECLLDTIEYVWRIIFEFSVRIYWAFFSLFDGETGRMLALAMRWQAF
jgi:hypothetical protein